MIEELSKIYEPKQVEARASDLWKQHNSFHACPSGPGGAARPVYTIVIPPPNVTAALHLGHALNNTLQDILIRFRRMQGYDTLWMPGTDHAGIATQTVVEKRILAEEGKRRTDFAREEFIERVQAWKDEYEARIIEQLQLMGCSCDWQRTRFTMDEVCARAVRETFFRLFKDGIIYRGKRLVNWDPATQTVLADDEVEHETVEGHFWYMQYPLAEPVEINGQTIKHVTVATTRPETMLGDTAVAMNPRDQRAEKLVGKKVCLPLVGRIIPIIADEHVVLPDPDSDDEKAKFSTGFLKVTPAHDPDDWAIGERHELPVINVMAPDGSISDQYGWEDAEGTEAEQFLGMDRFEAREAIVGWFRSEKLLEAVREYSHEIGHSYRSHVPIEPYLSDQWYIAVKKPIDRMAEKFGTGLIEGTDVPVNSLAGLALKPLLDSRLRFVPERYAKTYQAWLENLRDWPISRQLWWGHRIPMWSKTGDGGRFKNNLAEQRDKVCFTSTNSEEETVTYCCVVPGHTDIERQLENEGWQRDEDVLDTWFSSALWPFSTLGWPEENFNGEPLLKTYYPGSVLCTAREIITLWVSRMVMMGQYCVGDIPFEVVFIHAMIQDGQGRKMSKSLGNGIDPLVAIDSHGADAMRFALAKMTTLNQDVRMPVEPMQLPDGRTVNTSPKFDDGRSFCNKLWNASRFALSNLHAMPTGLFDPAEMRLEDRWILSRLAQTIEEVTDQLGDFKFREPIDTLYRFFWNELCDWYLELIKPRMRDEALKPTAQRVLALVMDAALRLFHPFLPFITEGIYQQLNAVCPERGLEGCADLGRAANLVSAGWPGSMPDLIDKELEERILLVQNTIRMIRDVRMRYQVPPRKELEVSVKTGPAAAKYLLAQQHLICHMANVGGLQAGPDCSKPAQAAIAVGEGMEVYVDGVIDVQAELERLQKQMEELAGALKRCEAKLENDNFVNRAKPEVVQRERDRLEQLKEQLATVEKNLEELS